jgi:Fe-S-cluster containining protein
VRRPRPSYDETALLDELRAIYGGLDRALAGFSCDASTDCCHFERTGREPWVTDVEWAVLAKALGRLGGQEAVAAKNRRSLPLLNEGRCPLLDASGRCSAYEARPLGCRTFFCERVQGPGRVPRDAVRDALRALQAIAERFSPASPTGRPLRQRFEGRR